MRASILLPFALFSAPAFASQRIPLDVPVNAPAVYGAQGPRPIPSDHALYGRILVEPVSGMPKRIGNLLVPITKPAEFDAALQTSFGRANMLATGAAAPAARLTVSWRSIDAPARISTSAHATVVISYQLNRIDNGETIFEREITTRSSARGGDASERLKANARLAIQKNIASAIACLDQAAYGTAPADCTIGAGIGLRAAPRPRSSVKMIPLHRVN